MGHGTVVPWSLGALSLGECRVDTHILGGLRASAWAMLSSFFHREPTAGSGCAFLPQPPASFKGSCQQQTHLKAQQAWALLQALCPGLCPVGSEPVISALRAVLLSGPTPVSFPLVDARRSLDGVPLTFPLVAPSRARDYEGLCTKSSRAKHCF